jgi:UV DNA damage endonuclease
MSTMPFASIRWGLCCQFLDAPLRFRSATHRFVSGLSGKDRKAYLGQIAVDNAGALVAAIEHCHALGIGAFRINSQILPLATHPVTGYRLELVDPGDRARALFQAARARAQALDIRLSFHPDQFVVLNSEREEVVLASLQEIEYQTLVAELVGADTIVVHGGSSAGGMAPALERLARGIERLSPAARGRLALENDDRRFTPALLLPVCRALDVPLVYDVHHHRCRPDEFSIEEATARMLSTWVGREPYAHISSPREGWKDGDPRPHAGFIDPRDIPACWDGLRMTVDVEAKEKERAVLRVRADAGARRRSRKNPARQLA